MSFSNLDVLHRRLARTTHDHYSTVEIAHEQAKAGIIVRVEILRSPGGLEALLAHAFEYAGNVRQDLQRINDPGWWAGIMCAAALDMGYPAGVMRGTSMRSRIHACIIVERGAMIEEWPQWPMVRVKTSAALLDLRSEEATRLGPSDADLMAYAGREGFESEIDVSKLREYFEIGVLEWSADRDEAGRLMICAAGRQSV